MEEDGSRPGPPVLQAKWTLQVPWQYSSDYHLLETTGENNGLPSLLGGFVEASARSLWEEDTGLLGAQV